MSNIVSVSIDNNIATISMDDGKANAIGFQLIEELSAAFDDVAEQKAKAVVLVGRPGKFSAGFDLSVMGSGDRDVITDLLVKGSNLLMKIYGFPSPVVMAVSGHAIAGGVLLAATGDTRIGIEGEFKLGLNEVSNGLPVPIFAHQLAEDRVSREEFVSSVLQSKIYDPKSALAAGWLDDVVEGESLLSASLNEAQRLAQLPAHAYAFTKLSIREASIDHINATLESNIKAMLGG